jgi:hypothetical protein
MAVISHQQKLSDLQNVTLSVTARHAGKIKTNQGHLPLRPNLLVRQAGKRKKTV